MSPQNTEIRGQHALQKLTRRQRLLSVLRKSDGPGRFTVEFLIVAASAGIAGFGLGRSTDRESLVAALAWVVLVVAWIGIQQWKSQRRLEAVIELLQLSEDEE